MQPNTNQPTPRAMTLLLLEAFGALALLIAIVWWTMFSGRPRGERPDATPPSVTADTQQSADKK
jgi:cytoskeletal protein RodZ